MSPYYFIALASILYSTYHSNAAQPRLLKTHKFFNTDYDAIVVGGGPAGLQAAMSIGRLGRSVMIFDSQEYRNTNSDAMHDVIGLDGTSPAAFRNLAKQNLETYPHVEYNFNKVESIKSVNDVFHVRDSNGRKYCARKLVLATGLIDLVPKYPGLDVIWARDKAYSCAWCSAWEKKDGKLAVLGYKLLNQCPILKQLNSELVVLTDGLSRQTLKENLPSELLCAADCMSIKIDDRPISKFELTRDNENVRVVFGNGNYDEYRAIYTGVKIVQRSNFYEDLHIPIDPEFPPNAKVESDNGDTAIYGVFLAGDMVSKQKNVVSAMSSGKNSGMAVIAQLGAEDARIQSGMPWKS